MPLQTYYGNPLSCTWSHDGQYIAAGGEDDLVSVFGMEEQRVVAWGEGHGSWVFAVSFDPWCDSSPVCTAFFPSHSDFRNYAGLSWRLHKYCAGWCGRTKASQQACHQRQAVPMWTWTRAVKARGRPALAQATGSGRSARTASSACGTW